MSKLAHALPTTIECILIVYSGECECRICLQLVQRTSGIVMGENAKEKRSHRD